MPYGPKAHEYQRRLDLEAKGNVRNNLSLTNIARNKTKLIAWFVSNCEAKSGRNCITYPNIQFLKLILEYSFSSKIVCQTWMPKSLVPSVQSFHDDLQVSLLC